MSDNRNLADHFATARASVETVETCFNALQEAVARRDNMILDLEQELEEAWVELANFRWHARLWFVLWAGSLLANIMSIAVLWGAWS